MNYLRCVCRLSAVMLSVTIPLCSLACSPAGKGTHSLIRPSNAPEYRDYDLVLEGQPVSVRQVKPDAGADAVAENEEPLAAIVVLKISQIVKGSLPKLRIKPSARANRFNKAVYKEKTLGSVIGSMMPKKTKVIERTRFSVAVRDPAESFGVTDWENPVPSQYRVYLKRYQKENNTYLMVKCERIQESLPQDKS